MDQRVQDVQTWHDSSEQLSVQQIRKLYQAAEVYATGYENKLVCQYARHKDYDSFFWNIVADAFVDLISGKVSEEQA